MRLNPHDDEIDLMAELELADDPCPRGCGRSLEECEDDDKPCAGSPLVRELERELFVLRNSESLVAVERDRLRAEVDRLREGNANLIRHAEAFAEDVLQASIEADRLRAELATANGVVEAAFNVVAVWRKWDRRIHGSPEEPPVIPIRALALAVDVHTFKPLADALTAAETSAGVGTSDAASNETEAAVGAREEHNLDRLRENCRLAEEALKAELERRRIADRARRCGAIHSPPGMRGFFVCVLDKGHDGNHVAGDLHATEWPNDAAAGAGQAGEEVA